MGFWEGVHSLGRVEMEGGEGEGKPNILKIIFKIGLIIHFFIIITFQKISQYFLKLCTLYRINKMINILKYHKKANNFSLHMTDFFYEF